jgi:hypothetical protein
MCKTPLVDKPFGCKNELLFCGECYNQQFASRCDKCNQIFKPGYFYDNINHNNKMGLFLFRN